MISLVSYNYVISYQRDSKFGHFIYKKQEADPKGQLLFFFGGGG